MVPDIRQIAWLGLIAVACARDGVPKSAPPGSLEGNVYLVMKSGDVKKGAGNQVTAIAAPDTLLGLLTKACLTADSERVELRSQATAALTRAKNAPMDLSGNIDEQVNRNFAPAKAAGDRSDSFDPLSLPLGLLRSIAGPSSGTGMEAHYVIDSLPPGRVILWAETKIGENHYLWVRVAEVLSGQRTRADLDNSTILDTRGCTLSGYYPPPVKP